MKTAEPIEPIGTSYPRWATHMTPGKGWLKLKTFLGEKC